LVEQIAGVGDYLVALATYRAARHRFIDLRESPSRCATICRIVSVGLPGVATRQALLDLAPPQRGFFLRVLRAARNQQRGWALRWWACCVSEGPCEPCMARHKDGPT
jgi:hypothetical protein